MPKDLSQKDEHNFNELIVIVSPLLQIQGFAVSSQSLMNQADPNIAERILLRRIAAGNEAAFHELVNQYAHYLFSFIFRIMPNRPMAEELVQDTFVKIWLTRENLEHVQNFKAYLFTVSKNYAIKAVQRALREKTSHAAWIQEAAKESADQIAEWKFELLDEAVNNLPPQQQKVWTLSRREGHSYKEIAASMDISTESVKKYLKLANRSITTYVTSRVTALLFAALLSDHIIH